MFGFGSAEGKIEKKLGKVNKNLFEVNSMMMDGASGNKRFNLLIVETLGMIDDCNSLLAQNKIKRLDAIILKDRIEIAADQLCNYVGLVDETNK